MRKLGHDVRLMPAAYVKPYVKRGKTDAADAEAICEAGGPIHQTAAGHWYDFSTEANEDASGTC